MSHVLGPIQLRFVFTSPLPFLPNGSAQRVSVRGLIALLLLLRGGLRQAGVSVVLCQPTCRRRDLRTLRAPYKNKGAWSPYSFTSYNQAVVISFAPGAPLLLGFTVNGVYRLFNNVRVLEVAHATLAIASVHWGATLGPIDF
jgi:hypothetical protein